MIPICLISGILTLCFASAVFILSSQTAGDSGQTSGYISKTVFRVLFGDESEYSPEEASRLYDLTDSAVRTCAHFCEYLLLGASSSSFALSLSVLLGGGDPKKSVIIAAAGCVLFAVSDEIHQIFVPGRAFEISDIVTDSAGVLIGCLLIYLFRRKLIRQ